MLEHLAAIRSKASEKGPFLQSIWVIGHRGAYWWLVEQFVFKYNPTLPTLDDSGMHLMGIPLYECALDRCPDMLLPPRRGIWFVMSDGNHRHFMLVEGHMVEVFPPDAPEAYKNAFYEDPEWLYEDRRKRRDVGRAKHKRGLLTNFGDES